MLQLQPQKLSLDQLQRRTKELDARELYIQARESLLSEVEQYILANQLKIKQLDEYIDVQQVSITAKQKILDLHQVKLDGLDLVYNARVDELKTDLELRQSRIKDSNKVNRKAMLELAEVNKTINQRQDYLKEQEYIINDMVEAGNTKIKGINYELNQSEHTLKEQKLENRTLRQDKKMLDDDLANARQDFLGECGGWESKISDLTIIFQDETERGQELHRVNDEFLAEVDQKMIILNTKEASLVIKREEIQREHDELLLAQRRFSGAKSLYDV